MVLENQSMFLVLSVFSSIWFLLYFYIINYNIL